KNDPAISSVQWLADSRTIAFLGAPAGQLPQIYTVDVTTRKVTTRTNSPTGVATQSPTGLQAFQIAANGSVIIYQRRAVLDTSGYAAKRAHGFVYPQRAWLSDMIAGDWVEGMTWYLLNYPKGYRIARGNMDEPLELPDSASGLKDCDVRPDFGPSIAPNGDALIIVCSPVVRPVVWNNYHDTRYPTFADEFGDGRMLVRLDPSGEHRPIIDAPLPDEAVYVWSRDGKSLVIGNALLPLAGADSARRSTQRMLAEVDVRTGAITVIAPRDSLVVQSWNARSGLVSAAVAFDRWTVAADPRRQFFKKSSRGWQPVPAAAALALEGPSFRLDQGADTPPRLVVVTPRTHQSRVIFDPNPELASRRFGRTEVFHWTTKSGRGFAGGLYLPPNLVPGQRYPLVIQTHGYDSTRFFPDGVFTTDEAAQPLANAGIVVLQAQAQVSGPRMLAVMETPDEAPAMQDAYEGAIDALVRRGLIDRTRVGLQGFSRTCFYTLYFLTHSSYPLAAATIADGVDYGYLQHLVWGPFGRSSTTINGGQPWGPTQATYLEHASGFRLDRVTAPLRVTAIQPFSLLEEWEPYAGLRLLGKPTEMIYIPDGAHVLVKPWERMTSQQGVVDWWRFWLEGYEDPDTTKVDQYARWRQLRAQRDSTARSGSSSFR
ncbi:MAG TPA: hypothetical protein VG454_04965, partial [Gemmatimonadales bacterium]|nr:hypothetical protein [Gemmatimonadales bacterium]